MELDLCHKYFFNSSKDMHLEHYNGWRHASSSLIPSETLVSLSKENVSRILQESIDEMANDPLMQDQEVGRLKYNFKTADEGYFCILRLNMQRFLLGRRGGIMSIRSSWHYESDYNDESLQKESSEEEMHQNWQVLCVFLDKFMSKSKGVSVAYFVHQLYVDCVPIRALSEVAALGCFQDDSTEKWVYFEESDLVGLSCRDMKEVFGSVLQKFKNLRRLSMPFKRYSFHYDGYICWENKDLEALSSIALEGSTILDHFELIVDGYYLKNIWLKKMCKDKSSLFNKLEVHQELNVTLEGVENPAQTIAEFFTLPIASKCKNVNLKIVQHLFFDREIEDLSMLYLSIKIRKALEKSSNTKNNNLLPMAKRLFKELRLPENISLTFISETSSAYEICKMQGLIKHNMWGIRDFLLKFHGKNEINQFEEGFNAKEFMDNVKIWVASGEYEDPGVRISLEISRKQVNTQEEPSFTITCEDMIIQTSN